MLKWRCQFFFFFNFEKDRKPCAGDSVPHESDREAVMLKPLDSSAERRQLSGAFSILSRSGPCSPHRLAASQPHRVCETPADVCSGARQNEAPEATQESGNSIATESGKGPRANFREGDKLGEAHWGPQHTPARGPWSGGVCWASARWLAGQPRARRGRWRPYFAPLPLWPWFPVAAAAWVFPLARKRAVLVPVPWPGSLRHQPERRRHTAVFDAGLCACERQGSGPLASPPPLSRRKQRPFLDCSAYQG